MTATTADGKLPYASMYAQQTLSPVDLEHLREFASGDRRRVRKFLSLFLNQSNVDFKLVERSRTQEEWREAVHSLKSSASAIGAWGLVNVADEILDRDEASQSSPDQTHVDDLNEQLAEVTRFIEDYLRRE